MTALLGPVLAAFDAGLCPIRAETDGSKKPIGTWKKYESERPPRNRVVGWFRNGHPGYGTVCGAISGNLEMFEFEGRAVAEGVLDAFIEAAETAGLTGLVGRISGGYCERTPTGGIHLLYRCEDAVDRNLQLARRPPTAAELEANPADKMKVLIETRGEGGFTILQPSNGTTHPNGGAWELMHGGFDSIAVVTQEERQAFLALARTFDQCPEAAAAPRAPQLPRTPTGDSMPSEEFDSTYTCADVLTAAGFVFHREDQNGQHYTRPGKATREGSSATVWKASRAGGDRCTLFSSSIDAPLEFLDGRRALTAWQLHVALNYGVDFSEAARQWRQDHPRPTDLSWITQASAGHPGHGADDSVPADPAAPDRDGGEDAAPPPGGLLPTPIDWVPFWAKDRTAEDWLLEPFLPNGRMTAVWADRKAGKSLLSLEVAAALATGRPILGRPRSTPIHVDYFDLEMTEDDLYERLEDMGYGPDVDLSHLHYYLLPSLPPLDTAEGGSAVEAIVVRDQAQVVVIDTMARVVKGEENESTTYRAFYQHTGLRLKMRGITGLRLDHSGKDPTKGARGSSAKGDDIDLGWELKVADDGAVILTRKLTRVSWVPDRVALRRLADPLRHVLAAGPVWPAGTKDTADDLDRLAVPITATCATAMATLKEHDLGRRKNVILAALKWRRQLAEDAAEQAGTAPGTALPDTTPEPPREPEGRRA